MDTTLSNYANMIKRLNRKSKVSNLVLIYYSLFLIICSLTSKFFPPKFNEDFAAYFNIIISIVVLVYSLINNNANYTLRIAKIQESLNGLKSLKRKVDDQNINECVESYYKISDITEQRAETDFFQTVRILCKENNVSLVTKKVKKANDKIEVITEDEENKNQDVNSVISYISEINVPIELCKIFCEFFGYVILILASITLFIMCILLGT